MQRLTRILLWRPEQPALVRWLEAVALVVVALVVRDMVGPLNGLNPALIYFPAICLATMLLGWMEAVFVLVASIAIGWYWIHPSGFDLIFPVWLIVGSIVIAGITALRRTGRELASANERQRILFQVARQRVAKTPVQFSVPEETKAALSPARAEAVRILEDAARRIAGAADVHSRLHNPALLQRELDSILRDTVATVIDRRSVNLAFDVDPLELTFDLMSTITMLVLEIANESQRTVFQSGMGSSFSVALKALPDNRATLTVKDDGALPAKSSGSVPSERSDGLDIVQALVSQMRGTLRTSFVGGAEFAIEFPLGR